MKTVHALLPTLAFAFVGHILVVAQDAPPPPPPPPAPVALDLPLPEVQAAMEQVHQQVQHVNAQVQRQLAHAQRALELAQLQTGSRNLRRDAPRCLNRRKRPKRPSLPTIPSWDGTWNRHSSSWMALIGCPRELQGPSTSEPLVIPAATTDAVALAEMREDLAIMSRILQKATGRTGDRGDTMALGIVVSSFPALRRPQAMYLADYGAVFLLNVPFPLVAPADTQAAPAEKPTNTAWEEARRELYGPKRAPMSGWVQKAAGARREVNFEPERVERLKREVMEALKNAANLRQVKPDEQVVVAITSTAGGGGRRPRNPRAPDRRRPPGGRACGDRDEGRRRPGGGRGGRKHTDPPGEEGGRRGLRGRPPRPGGFRSAGVPDRLLSCGG
ncbi:MAG: hypothetical protein M5U12_33315 [Verrucomicrobia bacterium]|nr:hypothetical protein [Verrucomicrobiota bacterium]